MTITKLASVIAVEDIAQGVAAWQAALGTAPSFVDGARWAQFDVAGGRIALAGPSEPGAGTMARSDDLDGDHARLAQGGLRPEPIVVGGHERRFAVRLPGGMMYLYQPA